MKTIQLRRYELGEGTFDTFMTWWSTHLLPVRTEFGFDVEFSYVVPERNEIVWACSLDGDRDHFLEVEARYDASPGRSAAFAHLPAGVLLGKATDFVEDADPRSYGNRSA
ncbi:MAG TPA: hypothetical protein VK139_06705 [Microbacteriaceae bacterium]|nr:hypothetical protein [Microbacteriaceae bacterium]